VLASRYAGIELVEHVLADLIRVRGWGGEEERQAVTTASREAVANAIRHGNGSDSDLPVQVHVAFVGDTDGRDEISVCVTDHGAGFEPESVPDPTAPENLLRASGRGIFYMKQLMDAVEFARAADGGTIVSMSLRTRGPVHTPVEAEGRKES
jgi:serine/threonine-protein kinase RsbW